VYHSSVLLDNKLYFSGGHNESYDNITNEFFYLDVSKPFTTTDNDSMRWVGLTYTSSPLKQLATACIGGKNNDMIFIFGGISPNANQSLVNQFDTNKQQWINITSVGNVPSNRNDFACASFDNGLIAIFSGISSSSNSTNDLWIFNTLTLTWSLSNATNAPLPMYAYCAVTLPDGNILYIGGSYFTNSPATGPVSMLLLYNTTSDTWTSKSTGGTFPPPRLQFSAVLSMSFSNVRNVFDGGFSLDVFSDLWILNTQALFEWSMGIISNPIVDLALYGHTATLVDNYMFISLVSFKMALIYQKYLC
ncbi:38667_t:CDS:2, partial [Gigaspora margarita]